MPTIKKIRLEGWQTISQRLHDAAGDLLPKHMAEHPVVQWVLSYDSLARRFLEADRGLLLGDQEIERFGTAAILGWMVATHLQAKLPFYFASLHHIGRMEVVSVQTRETIRRLRSEENFTASAENLRALLVSENDTGTTDHSESAAIFLQSVSTAALEHANAHLHAASTWWHMWVEEAGALKEAVSRLNEVWAQDRHGRSASGAVALAGPAVRILILCAAPSPLALAMNRAGVRMKLPSEISPQNTTANSVLGLLCLLGGDSPHDISFHVLQDWLHEERQRRIQPEVDIALQNLQVKCGTTNPFDEYLPLLRPAAPELRVLVQEHELPNGKSSPWRAIWERQLEPTYHGSSYNVLPAPVPGGGPSLEWAVRVADSAIKRHVTDALEPGESWAAFLQRIYEDYCVEPLGVGAGGANKKAGESPEVWSADSFVGFISTVTVELNTLGYPMVSPHRERLVNLLMKTTRGESVWGKGGW